jgi:hypothetical protein
MSGVAPLTTEELVEKRLDENEMHFQEIERSLIVNQTEIDSKLSALDASLHSQDSKLSALEASFQLQFDKLFLLLQGNTQGKTSSEPDEVEKDSIQEEHMKIIREEILPVSNRKKYGK